MGTRRFGTHFEEAVAEKEARSTARRNRHDIHLRRLDPDTGRLRLMNQFKFAAEPGNVRGCAAHVKTDNRLILMSGIGGHGVTHHAAGGTRQNGVAPLEPVR